MQAFRLILSIMVCFSVVRLSAQDKNFSRFSGYGLAGISMCQVDGDGEAGYKKLGGQAGLGVAVNLHKRWSLDLEMTYAHMGSYDATDRDGNGNTVNYKFNYLQVPLTANFHDWEVEDEKGRKYMKIQATLGVAYGQLFSSSIEGATVSQNLADDFKSYDIQWLAGAGVMFTRHWGMDIRFQQSLVPFNKSTINNHWHRLIVFRGKYVF